MIAIFLRSVLVPGLFILVMTACVTPSNSPPCPPSGGDDLCRPFHAGVIKLSSEIDAIKPLAPIDVSGWTLASDVLIANLDDRWMAGISAKDRHVLWWFETPTGVTAPIAVFGSWVVVGLRDGRVLKVEALTGKKVWEARLGKFAARPFVLGGSTLIGVTASQQVYGLDFQSGNITWMYDAGEPDNLAVRTGAPALVRDKQVYIGTDKGEIHAVDLETGKLEWRYNPEFTDDRFHDIVGELVTVNNQLVVTRYDGVVAALGLTGSDHAPLWKDAIPAITNSSFRNGIMFIGCLNGDVYAVDASSGRRLWRVATHQSVGTLSAGEKVLYAAGTDGRITAISIADGRVLWHDDIEGAIDTPPIILGDKIYFGTGLKVLYGFRLM